MRLEDRASRARAELDTLFDPVDAPPAARVRTVHRRRRAFVGATGLVVLAVAGISIALATRSSDSEPVRLTPPTTVTGAGQVTAHLELSETTVVAGADITGTLVIENDTGAPFRFGEECGTQFAVVLRNDAIPNDAVLFSAICEPVRAFAVGRTTLPFTVSGTYLGCAGDSSEPFIPCPPGGGLPPLPAGDYEATFVASDPTPLRPRPVPVTVVPPPAETTTSTASPPSNAAPPSFPPARSDLVHGEPTWAVVLAGAFVEPGTSLDANQTLVSAVAVAERGGYTTGPTDCDEGAAEAVGAGPDARDFYTVSVYFATEADARRANEAFAAQVGWYSGVVAQIRTFCLD
jgi:hypothetical protein